MNNFIIRARIKELRESQRISQTEFAEELGICRSSAINLETKAKLVSPRMTEIARVLKTTEEYLIFGTESDEERNLLKDSASEAEIQELKGLVTKYELEMDQLRSEIGHCRGLCSEQRDHINTLKLIIQRLDPDTNND